MDLIRRAQQLHQRTLANVAGEWVQYTDGEIDVRVRMVRGRSQIDNNIHDGDFNDVMRFVDWLIAPTDLVDDGEPVIPRRGARITPEAGDGVFELVPGPNGDVNEPADGRSVRFRLHSERIGDASE